MMKYNCISDAVDGVGYAFAIESSELAFVVIFVCEPARTSLLNLPNNFINKLDAQSSHFFFLLNRCFLVWIFGLRTSWWVLNGLLRKLKKFG
jgi:hypothetical protein